MRRRLFEGLQQAIKGTLREHVYFIDQIDLEAPAGRRVLRVIQYLAHVVDTGGGSRVNLQEINEASGIDGHTAGTLAAGHGTDTPFAIECLDKYPRDRGLADATRTGKQKSMMQAAGAKGIFQRTDHMTLACHIGKGLGTPLAGQREIAHEICRTRLDSGKCRL